MLLEELHEKRSDPMRVEHRVIIVVMVLLRRRITFFRSTTLCIVNAAIPLPAWTVILCESVGVCLPTRTAFLFSNNSRTSNRYSSSSKIIYLFLFDFMFILNSYMVAVTDYLWFAPPVVVMLLCAMVMTWQRRCKLTSFPHKISRSSVRYPAIRAFLIILNATKPYQTWYIS